MKKKNKPERAPVDGAVQNVYCEPGEWVVPTSCGCCAQCWKYVTGPRRGTCPFGGRFTGYREESV